MRGAKMILRIAIASFTAAMAAYAKPVFSVSAASVDVYDFIEVTARVAPGPSNPFVGASLNGELRFSNQQPLLVTGFCDSPDGSVFRIRFLATKPGPYNFAVSFHSADQ